MNVFSSGIRRNGTNSGFTSVFVVDPEWIKHQINSAYKSHCFLVKGLILLNLTFVIEILPYNILLSFFSREVFPGLMTPLTQSVTRRSTDLSVRHQLPHRPGYYYSANVITASHHALLNVFNVSSFFT